MDRSGDISAQRVGRRAERSLSRRRARARRVGGAPRARWGRVGRGRRRLHRDDDVHRTSHTQPRRALDRPARLPRRHPARSRRRHRVRLCDGRAPAGVELRHRVSGTSGARDRGRNLLGGVLPGRPARERGGACDLRRRRRRSRHHHRWAGAVDRRSAHTLPVRASRRDGVRVSRRAAARDPLQGRAPHRRGHDGRDGGDPDVDAGAQARGHRILGPPFRGPTRDRSRPHLARAERGAGRPLPLGAAPLRQHVIGHDPLRIG